MANIHILDPDPRSTQNGIEVLGRLMRTNPFDTGGMMQALGSVKMYLPPPRTIPCANIEPYRYRFCPKEGKIVCSACKLVSYCSKKCQQAHWKAHQEDCKHDMRSTKWKPESTYSEIQIVDMDRPSALLWGKIPAMDIINLLGTEKDVRPGHRIAFAASGDLRNVIATVNALPKHYSGKLEILLNDDNPRIIARNIAILLILTGISDINIAVDTALHFWYSAFFPSEYRLQLVGVLSSFLKETLSWRGPTDSYTKALVNRSRISIVAPAAITECYTSFLKGEISVNAAQLAFSEANSDLARKRYRDLRYFGMRPSHRVAFWQYRSYGIALPHSATSAHFNRSNPSLLGPNGDWLLSDTVNFLGGWDMDEMVQIGAKHHAHPEDIYGCFYFTVTEKLKTFVERLKSLNISFVLTNSDPSALPGEILAGNFAREGIPTTAKFDRISLSNAIEKQGEGLEHTLSQWSSLLSDTPSVSILGEFVSWKTQDLTSLGDKEELERAFQQMVKQRKILGLNGKECSMGDFFSASPFQGQADVQTYCDTSKAFQKYLDERGFADVLEKSGLSLRQKHLIIPHRIYAPVGASHDSLPVFPSDDSWYFNTKLTGYSWTERFVEIAKSKSSSE